MFGKNDPPFPTTSELDQLFQQRGKTALVWFAWRNALRALPLLGSVRLTGFWRESTIQHVYAVCRSSVLLGVDIPSLEIVGLDRAAAKAMSSSPRATYASAYVRAVAYANTKSNYGSVYAKAQAPTDLRKAAAIASRADFDWLVKQGVSKDNPSTVALWSKKRLFRGGKPKQIEEWEQSLLQQLRQIGLDFLAEDIQALWEGRPIDPKRLENYAKDLTEEITNDPVALSKAILGEVDKIQAVRCLLLGPGGAGKSSLADRLQGRQLEKTEKDGTTYVKVKSVTTGVDYLEHQPLKLDKHFKECNLGEKPLDLYLWDFGGQTIFHGLHSAFLHENCVYVLVVDSRHEQAPDEWLHQIEHLAGSARVLLVTNWYENCESRQNETRLLRKFPNLLSSDSFFYFSCHEPHPEAFREFVESLVRNAFASQVASFAEELEIWEELKKELKQQVFIGGGKVKRFIRERLEHGDAADTMKRYRGLGFLVEVVDQEGFYCLDPSWAVDNGYRLLHAEPLRQVRDNNKGTAGIADLPTLKEYLDEKHEVDEEETKHLVDFLKDRNLCCQLAADRRYFFPDAASADEPESVKALVNQEESLTVRFDLPYLPLGFHAGMVSRLFQTNKAVAIRQPADIWRQGFILHGDGDRAKAVVSYQMRKSTIGLVLVGEDLAEAANILESFRVALHEVLGVGKSGIEEAHLQPFVVWNEWASTLLSGNELISLLGSTGSYGELVEKIKQLENEVKEAMASKYNISVGDNSQVAVDAKHVTQQHQSNNVEVTVDQREQIALMAGVLLENFKDLNPEELTAVAVVNQALEEPEEEQSQKLLGTVVSGLDKTVGFANNAVGVGEFVAKNWGAITAAFTAAAAVIS